MTFNFNFYSSLLLIFVSNGLLYSFLILKKALVLQSQANKWLSLFVFLCSLYIMPWMLGFSGWYDQQPYRDFMFYMPFQHLFFIGPVLFFYVQSLLNPNFKLTRSTSLHLLPGILYLLYSLIIFVVDKIILKKYYFYADGTDKDFDPWYQYLGFASMVFYLLLSLKYYQKFILLMQNIVSYADNFLFKWVKTFLIAFLSMQMLQVIFFIIGFFVNIDGYVGSWWYFFCFAIIMLYIAISGYNNNLDTYIPFEFDSFQNQKVLLLSSTSPEVAVEFNLETTTETTFNNEDILVWKSKVTTLFELENAAQNPELTLNDLAKNLKTNVSVVSKVINQGFEMNFNDFVNKYRIDQVKLAFQNGEHKKTTLLGIAFDCGFNSKATFNRAFKKNTGLSPKDYLAKV